MPRRFFSVLALALYLAGCAPTAITVPDTSDMDVPMAMKEEAHENLHAVLWTQTAAEFRALTLQTYAAARAALDEALADPTWTAAPEQLEMGGFAELPPAVVLDVDETVLDNAAYQARQIEDGTEFSSTTWSAWVEEAAAPAVPGALAFTRAADSLGIAVIYLTNRRGTGEAATRRNLERLGFPIRTDFDAVLMRDDRTRTGEPEFETGEKRSRREVVAERFRVLALLGDNLGDFLSDVDGTVAERDRLAAPYASWWGRRWFMLPNPQYGSWESALLGERGLSRDEQLRRKASYLETGRE